MRIFIAIEFNEKTKKDILNIQNELKSLCKNGRWTNKNNMHLTLKFLGDVDSNRINNIDKVLKQVANRYKKFNLGINRIGKFGKDDIKVLWLGIFGEINKLSLLNKDIENNLVSIGFQREQRSFSPHITLGREVEFKEDFNNIKSIIEKYQFEEFQVNKIALMSSELVGGKRVYTAIHEYELV